MMVGGLAALLLASAQVFAQSGEVSQRKINFGFSPNPRVKEIKTAPEPTPAVAAVVKGPSATVEETTSRQPLFTEEEVREGESPVAAPAPVSVPLTAIIKAQPTEIYQVGIGDVLFINLQNAPRASTLYTVLEDGTIDYPLAGDPVSVLGMTTEEIEVMLTGKVRLFENPKISVSVRDYSSHSIKVLGLVERPGEKFLQREAMPLFAVRAEAVVSPNATTVSVRRINSVEETLSLKDPKWEDVLVFPGDVVEFTATESNPSQPRAGFFVIGGAVNSPGQLDFKPGLTLTQAILIAGGPARADVRKGIIHRRSSGGFILSAEYDLKKIRDGKTPDPIIITGDTIVVLQ